MKNHNEPRKLKLKQKQQSDLLREPGQPRPDLDNTCRHLSANELKVIIDDIQALFNNPFRKPNKAAARFLRDAIEQYERAVKATLGVPTYTENVTLQYEAPNDIPTVPLSGIVPISRTAYIVKLAAEGSAAGGFFCKLTVADLSNWVSTYDAAKYFRIKKLTSWTCPRQDGNVGQGTFAGVSIPVSASSTGTEVTPAWSENWEPVGQGFAGIVTKYPLGGYPLYSLVGDSSISICSHFTSLGGTGGVTGIPVVFHVEIETLI